MRIPDLLHGPAPALPAAVDRVAETWARQGPRARVLVGSLVVTLLLAAAGGGLRHGRWGPPVEVWVAAVDLPVGTAVDGALVRAERPAELVAPDALAAPPGPDTRTVAVVPAGSVLTDRHVAPGGPSGLVPEGWADVPVPVDALPDAPVGTHLHVVAARFDGGATTVAERARVVRRDGDRAWVRVPRDAVAGLASALTSDGLVTAVVP